MAELEAIIERRLIDQLCSGESQWTYRLTRVLQSFIVE